MLDSGARIIHIAKELSRQFDAIQSAIDTIDDAETRIRLKQSTILSQEALLNAMLHLSQGMGKVINQFGA
jgi:hypothetical protein